MNTSLITKDFNGHSFVFREDGYFNMTKAAANFGKDLSNFMRSPDTEAYIGALEELNRGFHGSIIEVRRGNGVSPSVGTWGHPKIAVRFAQWLDPRFSVWCDSIIEDILSKKAELVVTKPTESATVATTQALGANNGMVKALAMFMEASATT